MKFFLPTLMHLMFCSSCSTPRNAAVIATEQKTDHVLLSEWVFLLEEFATDTTYGFSAENPVKVGGGISTEGVKNERRFINALAGPEGEEISYERLGSCCSFKSKDSYMGYGVLDMYQLTWETDTVMLYLNMYESGELKVPVGLTIKEFW